MDQEGVRAEQDNTTPLFGAYRRGGYDPAQVDRYVADQARRLEAAEERAAEAERRLAAAVGQLRELHRRVAVLESEDRSPQPQSLDTLGERVQRILQEAWEGAYALRQSAEQEVAELRERAAAEAAEILEAAEARAKVVDEEIERRRKAYLARLEEDRSRAVAQVSYLHEQRRLALAELVRVKEIIEATVGDTTGPRGTTPRADAEVSPLPPSESLFGAVEPNQRRPTAAHREADVTAPARSRITRELEETAALERFEEQPARERHAAVPASPIHEGGHQRVSAEESEGRHARALLETPAVNELDRPEDLERSQLVANARTSSRATRLEAEETMEHPSPERGAGVFDFEQE